MAVSFVTSAAAWASGRRRLARRGVTLRDLRQRALSAPDAAELRAWASERLSAYGVPEVFWFVPALPLNPNGKVDRKQLEAIAARSAGKP